MSWSRDSSFGPTPYVRRGARGETCAPLDMHALDVVDGLLAAARELGDGRVGHVGFSFGADLSGASGVSALLGERGVQ